MIDDKNDSLNVNEEAELENPPPAHFDESASANAQPVQPIPTQGVAFWMHRTRGARQVLNTRTKRLALVLVAGLTMGALGGTMLVKERNETDAAPVVQAASEPDPAPDATTDAGTNDAIGAAQASATVSLGALQAPSRNRRHHTRLRIQRGPQAYRVAVIR